MPSSAGGTLPAVSNLTHGIGVTGCPILAGVAGHLDCTLVASHDAGDHVIFIGEVQALDVASDRQPLLFHGGGYRLLQEPR